MLAATIHVLAATAFCARVLVASPADAAGDLPSVPPTVMTRLFPTSFSAVVRQSVAATNSSPKASTWPVDTRLLAVGAGAVVGVVAFNLLTVPLGVVPLAGGALAAVPYSAALRSRLIAVASAGAGALGATWLYDRWTGQQSDYAYLATLGAGAVAGVVACNYLAMGTLGAPPYYVGAGVANAAGALASPAAQAASRVYVVGSAVLGAWAADWLYRR
jgi:hypothetical protein